MNIQTGRGILRWCSLCCLLILYYNTYIEHRYLVIVRYIFCQQTSLARKKRSGSILSMKSHLSTGYRYHDDKLISMTIPSPEASRTYLFEPLIGKLYTATIHMHT